MPRGLGALIGVLTLLAAAVAVLWPSYCRVAWQTEGVQVRG